MKVDGEKMSEKIWDEFVRIGEEAMRLWDMSSVSVGVVKGGETVFTHSFGKRDIENDLDADQDTLYQIASCTKAFTAAVCCTLADQGLLDLDEPIRTYCPEIRFYDDYTSDNVSVKDLLCHRTGLPRHEFAWYGSSFTRRQLCENMAHLEPNEGFRTKFQYCNYGYTLASYVCERVSGKTFEQLLSELILDPLEMKRSNIYTCDILEDPNHGVPYGRPHDGDGMTGQEVMDFFTSSVEDKTKERSFPDAAAGCINSSVGDMLKWLKFNLAGGKVGDRQLISEKMMAQMHKPQMIRLNPMDMPNEFTDFMCYGLGWFVEMYRGHKYIYHGGNINGFSAYMALMPDLDLGIVILTNMDSTFVNDALGRTIIDLCLGIRDTDWAVKYRDFLAELLKGRINAYAEFTGPKILYTAPSHPIAEYAGIYVKAGYPDLKVEEENDVLYAYLGGVRIPLAHYHYDVFTSADTVGLIEKGLPFVFSPNENGSVISSVSTLLLSEVNTKPVEFKKK